MPDFINPFDALGGYTLADMTTAINLLPNQYSMISDMGLFSQQSTTQFTIVVEKTAGTLNLLPTVTRGGPATVGNRDLRDMRAFAIPHIPHDDVILPQDVQGIRAFGTASQAETVAGVMQYKMQRMRDRHTQTLEYMQLRALQGITKDGAGNTIYDWYSEFDLVQETIFLHLSDSSADVGAYLRAMKRKMVRNLHGETMTTPLILCSPGLWDKFIHHAAIVDAYKYFTANVNPLRDDVRGADFVFQGVAFREYDATFTLFGGSTEEAIGTDLGIAFPQGTRDTFKTIVAPANLMETVNTPGQLLYARQMTRLDGRGIDLLTESNPLPMVRRPNLVFNVSAAAS